MMRNIARWTPKPEPKSGVRADLSAAVIGCRPQSSPLVKSAIISLELSAAKQHTVSGKPANMSSDAQVLVAPIDVRFRQRIKCPLLLFLLLVGGVGERSSSMPSTGSPAERTYAANLVLAASSLRQPPRFARRSISFAYGRLRTKTQPLW